jgi:nucleotide-binding universal stress UspA family protein
MNINSLRRWANPKAILAISTASENPAHTLRVISGLRSTGARLFLVPLTATMPIMFPGERDSSFPGGAAFGSFKRLSAEGAGHANLWAEILSEVTVVRNTPIERVPALADSLGVDLVVMTASEIGRIPLRARNNTHADLFGSLLHPILICGSHLKRMSQWDSRELRKILVPFVFGPNLPRQLRFACRFARRHHSRLTLLHVFESQEAGLPSRDRSISGLEARLPLAELKQEGILCPMEIATSEGYPERKILSFNEDKPHDLILMGGPRKRALFNGMGNGVTEAVLARAQCPVLFLGSGIMGMSSGQTAPNSELNIA